MQFRATIHGELNTYTGYGQHLIEIVRGLERLGGFVNIRPIRVQEAFGTRIPLDIKAKVVHRLQPEPYEILLAPPHHLPTPGKKTIYYTMWETTRLPEKSVELLNKAERVIVPCWWCKDNFEASGVTVPISVVPLGVDPAIFKPTPVREDGPCIFGAAGRLAHGVARKGLHTVIECFQRAFPGKEDVILRLKVHPDCQLPEYVAKDPRIDIIRQHLPPERVAEWLSELTCFVSGATAEAWGLWQHQALACGRPLIGSCYAGLTEYFKEGMGWQIPFMELPAREGFAGRGLWAEPSVNAMTRLMRHCFQNRDSAVRCGKIASDGVKHLTWEASIFALRRAIEFPEDYAERPQMPSGIPPEISSNNWFPVSDKAEVRRMTGKSISAVVCVYKTKTARLNRCLAALLPHVEEVILSIDGDGVEPEHIVDPKIRVVRNSLGQRIGYGRTANIGCKAATGDWLLLVNDDVYVNGQTIPKLLEAVTKADIAAVGCLLFYPDGRINHGGIYRSQRNFAHIDHESRVPTIQSVTEMEAVTLGCALIRRDAFNEIGGFDEQYDCYYEDMDLCLTLRKHGWRIVYTPFANAIHEESQTSGSLGSDFKKQRLAESQVIMMRKWADWFDANEGNRFGVFK